MKLSIAKDRLEPVATLLHYTATQQAMTRDNTKARHFRLNCETWMTALCLICGSVHFFVEFVRVFAHSKDTTRCANRCYSDSSCGGDKSPCALRLFEAVT